MTNDKLCDLLGGAGFLLCASCFALTVLGFDGWAGIIIGIIAMVASQLGYDR